MASKTDKFVAPPMEEPSGIDSLFASISANTKVKNNNIPELEKDAKPSAPAESEMDIPTEKKVSSDISCNTDNGYQNPIHKEPNHSDFPKSLDQKNTAKNAVPPKKKKTSEIPSEDEDADTQMVTAKIPRNLFLDVEARMLTAKRVSGQKITKQSIFKDGLSNFAYGSDVMCPAGHRFIITNPEDDVSGNTVFCPCCGKNFSLSLHTGFFLNENR